MEALFSFFGLTQSFIDGHIPVFSAPPSQERSDPVSKIKIMYWKKFGICKEPFDWDNYLEPNQRRQCFLHDFLHSDASLKHFFPVSSDYTVLILVLISPI